jgi:hypothetical protein
MAEDRADCVSAFECVRKMSIVDGDVKELGRLITEVRLWQAGKDASDEQRAADAASNNRKLNNWLAVLTVVISAFLLVVTLIGVLAGMMAYQKGELQPISDFTQTLFAQVTSMHQL